MGRRDRARGSRGPRLENVPISPQLWLRTGCAGDPWFHRSLGDGAAGRTTGLSRLCHRRAGLHAGTQPAERVLRAPLETLDAGARAFATAAAIDGNRAAVLAASVGTTVALSWLSDGSAPEVAAVIVISPSSVVWQGLGEGGPPPTASSLTRGAQELPYVPIRGEKLLGQTLRGRAALAPGSPPLARDQAAAGPSPQGCATARRFWQRRSQ